ncbi:MAG TPA: hypothetical protein VFE05_24510 [Longimicrobiaceae bacterium]|jgi:hypothetical protein|nr:hypothetical protein [Longimicrobiaceae bacterium]
MQRKLKLDVEKLNVDSFEAQEPMLARGTVIGQYSLGCDTLNDGTCRGNGTCGIYPCHPIP